MLFLGKHAFSQGLYHRAIDWLGTAKELASQEINSTEILEEIRPSLRSAIEVVSYQIMGQKRESN